MRRVMIPVLLLTAAALSTGVELPLLQPFDASPDPSRPEDQDGHSLSNTLTECEILKRVFCKNANWLIGNKAWNMLGGATDNTPGGVNYNEYLNKGRGFGDYYGSKTDPSIGSLRPFDRLQKALKLGSYDSLKNNNNGESGNFGYLKKYPPAQDVNTNEAVYTTHVDPLEFFKQRLYRQYKNLAYQHLYYDNPSTEEEAENPEEREEWENNPLAENVIEKRDDDFGPGQKEIPDTLVFAEDQKNGEQKKLFSFWSRLQSMSQKGRKLPTRRYSFVYYGPDGVRDGPLTAEIRASHLRPPGQPLRWG